MVLQDYYLGQIQLAGAKKDKDWALVANLEERLRVIGYDYLILFLMKANLDRILKNLRVVTDEITFVETAVDGTTGVLPHFVFQFV